MWKDPSAPSLLLISNGGIHILSPKKLWICHFLIQLKEPCNLAKILFTKWILWKVYKPWSSPSEKWQTQYLADCHTVKCSALLNHRHRAQAASMWGKGKYMSSQEHSWVKCSSSWARMWEKVRKERGRKITGTPVQRWVVAGPCQGSVDLGARRQEMDEEMGKYIFF